MSPPPPSSSKNDTPSKSEKITYILTRNLNDQEKANNVALSPNIRMKFILSNYKVVNFGRDPANNQLVLDSARKVNYRKKMYPNNIMVSREV